MEHWMFSWQARVPIVAGGYFLLKSDINVLRRQISHLCADSEFEVRIHEGEVLIEGNAPGITCAIAWDVGATIEAFAGRHAVNFFVYKTICNGKQAEHVMGIERGSSPGSRGEPLPSFDRMLGEKTLPRWAPLSCTRLLDSAT